MALGFTHCSYLFLSLFIAILNKLYGQNCGVQCVLLNTYISKIPYIVQNMYSPQAQINFIMHVTKMSNNRRLFPDLQVWLGLARWKMVRKQAIQKGANENIRATKTQEVAVARSGKSQRIGAPAPISQKTIGQIQSSRDYNQST